MPPQTLGPLATLTEVFANASLAPEPVRAPFGVCYVAFTGEHESRYRNEHMLEIAARQARAATAARGAVLQQCIITDQPERPWPYVDLALPLRTHLDAAPYMALCARVRAEVRPLVPGAIWVHGQSDGGAARAVRVDRLSGQTPSCATLRRCSLCHS
jgi:hypothetical protein